MNLQNFKLIWEWLSKLSPDFLRLIVIMLIGIILLQCNSNSIRYIIQLESFRERKEKAERELYTIDITPKIYSILEDITEADTEATNVILLNYHNTLTSSHGLSYRYLTGLCESFKDSSPCIDYWKELDYMNYGEEIQRITIKRYLLMSDATSYRLEYPKFTYLVERSGAKSAEFYPILGVGGSVGMLVILYKKLVQDEFSDRMRRIIAPNILPLAVLLDYDYVTKHN